MADDKNLHLVAVNAVVFNGNKFLVLKRKMDEIAFPGKWSFPGGKVEAGENLEEALVREIKEETGLDVSSIAYLGNYSFLRPDGKHVIGLKFLAYSKSGEVTAPDSDGYKWVTLEEFLEIDRIPGLEGDIKLALESMKNNGYEKVNDT